MTILDIYKYAQLETAAYVRGNPWAAVAVAGTLGLIIGAAVARRN